MSVCPSVSLTRSRPGSGLIIVVDESIAADCILSPLHTLLWMDVILYDHFRLKYAKLVTMTSQESSITSQNSHHIVTLHHSHISLICVLSPQSECPPLHPCISASSSLSDTVFTATVCFCCCCCHPFFPVCVYCLQAASMFPLPAPGLMIRITPSHCTPTPGLYPGHRGLNSHH